MLTKEDRIADVTRKQNKTDSSAKKPPKRSGKAINVRVPESLRDQLDKLVDQTRRDLTVEVIIALEKHLATFDMWPVKESE